MTPEMSVATQWQSHLPALLACIAVTDGAVLELGVGHFSTPHLHALCGGMDKLLFSLESNLEWRQHFKSLYQSPHHDFPEQELDFLLRSFADFAPDPIGVAFIDHSPGGANRAAAFKALIGVSDFVVVHDAQEDAENFQAIEPMLEGLNWHLCTGYFPHTLCASKTRKIPEVLLTM